MPRILITGCSSGFGQAIAARFLDEGKAGPIDALVNNAGVGMLNVLEGADQTVKRSAFSSANSKSFATSPKPARHLPSTKTAAG